MTQALEELPTPALVVDYERLIANLDGMAKAVSQHSVRLRPHIKAHKTPDIGHLQLRSGAVGVTTAKLGEAEVFVDAGIEDVLLAYYPVGLEKIERLTALSRRAQVASLFDSLKAVMALNDAGARSGTVHDVYMEVNISDPTGATGRSGVPQGEAALALAKRTQDLSHINLKGILGFRGAPFIYAQSGSFTPEDIEAIAIDEGKVLNEVADHLIQGGVAIDEILAGSTPTAKSVASVPNITEVHPGEYAFYGMNHVGPGVCELADCALTAVVTVVGRPYRNRAIIDGGRKTLSGDINPTVSPICGLDGYGKVLDLDAQPIDGVELVSMHEEHGILQLQGEALSLEVGQRLRVIPNHVCTVTNLHDVLHVLQDGRVQDQWPIMARGKSQ